MLIELTSQREILTTLAFDRQSWEKMSWQEIKTRYLRLVPRPSESRMIIQLLQEAMAESDDVMEFAARKREEYEQTALLNGNQLDLALNQVLKHTLTRDLNHAGQIMFSGIFKRTPESAVMRIEEALHDPISRKAFFLKDEETHTTTAVPADHQPLVSSNVATTKPPQATFSPSAELQPLVGSNVAANKPPRATFSSAGEHTLQTGNQPSLADKRHHTQSTWKTWTCTVCNHPNAGSHFTCVRLHCPGKATFHQLPPESWQCSNQLCGRNIWNRDKICPGCLTYGSRVPIHLRKAIPSHWRPRYRTQW